MDRIKNIYQELYKAYGPQGWWPLSKGRLQTKHHSGPPSNSHDRWEIIVGAMLTQNTAWTNVEKAIENLNKAKAISIEKISKADAGKIGELIRPAGYYNQKSERLKIAAKYFLDNFKEKTIPSRDDLLSVKGIGPETADSILLYAFDIPTFVVDAYTKRIFSRVGLIGKEESYGSFQELFHRSLKKDTKMFKEYHALIVELAKQHCRTKPICEGCPLGSICKKNI